MHRQTKASYSRASINFPEPPSLAFWMLTFLFPKMDSKNTNLRRHGTVVIRPADLFSAFGQRKVAEVLAAAIDIKVHSGCLRGRALGLL